MGLFSKRIKARTVRSAVEFDEAVLAGQPVLVDFWKPDCQPCRIMDGIVDEIADEFESNATVLKVNLAQVPDLFARFKIRSTPTFVVLTREGDGLHLRFRHSGLIKKDHLVGQVQRAVDAR